jgi:hypothetical protein
MSKGKRRYLLSKANNWLSKANSPYVEDCFEQSYLMDSMKKYIDSDSILDFDLDTGSFHESGKNKEIDLIQKKRKNISLKKKHIFNGRVKRGV